MGHGHLGVVMLPTIGDPFEQAQTNFYPPIDRRSKAGEPILTEHRTIRMLVFGGTQFRDREPNDKEYTAQCFLLTIEPRSSTYQLKILPGAKLRCADKFIYNMQTHCDINLNTVTVIGNRAAHRINTGKRDIANLRWKTIKRPLGYGQALEHGWKDVINDKLSSLHMKGNTLGVRRYS